MWPVLWYWPPSGISTLNPPMTRASSIQLSRDLRIHRSHGCSNQHIVRNAIILNIISKKSLFKLKCYILGSIFCFIFLCFPQSVTRKGRVHFVNINLSSHGLVYFYVNLRLHMFVNCCSICLITACICSWMFFALLFPLAFRLMLYILLMKATYSSSLLWCMPVPPCVSFMNSTISCIWNHGKFCMLHL